ncbi:MAG: FAD:protein FMN transferase [Clostridia bacterium]|nr:FAD:protein FMN transferase [Clostridia bacterium]
MGKKRPVTIILALVCAAALAAGAVYGALSKEYTGSFTAMDTYNTVKVRGADAKKALSSVSEITSELDTARLSRHSDTSAVNEINLNRGGRIPEELAPYLDTLFEVYEKSGGAFDFTLGTLTDLWGIGTENERVPSDDEIKKALALTGADKLDYTDGNIKFPEGISLDFGASGKGIALDEIKKAYDGMRISRAVVSLGGSIMLYGSGKFTVGIKDPRSAGYMAVLTLGDCFVSTSGNYERYFEKDGVRYHHILDPGTGYPVNSGLAGVTVIAPGGTLSDALSTACFVLGREKGEALCQEFGCEAVFVYEDGGVYATDGVKDSLEITDDYYRAEGVK